MRLDVMKTKFSHNLVPCFHNSVVLLFDSYLQIDRRRCLLIFRTDCHTISFPSHAKLTLATVYKKELLQHEASCHVESYISL